jgi:O-antigen/teichoic acid export membrane protein
MAGGLRAWTASWVNAFGFLLIGWLYRRESRPFAILPERPAPGVTREMTRYVLPILPSVIFFALQGQISLFLISFSGHTRSIAEVGALGRLGQLFLLLSGFNGTVIEPFMAKLAKERVLRSYLLVLAIASCVCVVLCLIGFFEPNVLLLLLGPRYAALRRETGWLVLGSCLTYLTGVAWTMAAARRWVYWTTSWVSIGVILATQITFACLFKVNSTMQVILFTVATSGAYFVGTLFNGVYGFIHGPKIAIPEADTMQHILEQAAHTEGS